MLGGAVLSGPEDDFPLEASIPEGAASSESILSTEALERRPRRSPDYEKENRALVKLASVMVDPKSKILQTFADTILEVTAADSAGLSLLAKDGGKRFYWPAIAGAWKPHVEECLVVPFYVGGEAVGTTWAISHSDRRKFDSEDQRLMTALGQFASLAYRTAESIQELRTEITAREKAEATLRSVATGLEAKIRRLVDANIIGIFFWNLDGKIDEANEAFLNMLQYTRNDLVLGHVRWTDLTPEEWSARDELAKADLRAAGAVQPYEKEFFRKDGSRLPVLVGAALFAQGGDEGVAFVLDLSEEKHSGEALQRIERKARLIVEAALDAVVSMDGDGLITDWNKNAEDIFGWSRAEALGRLMSETIIPLRYREAHESGLRRFFKTGYGPVLNQRIEITALRRDGAEFPVELSVTPLKAGNIWTFSAFVRDISDRKRAEEQLRTSELNLRRMTETIPEMLWSATPDGAIDYCNARVLDYTGLAQNEIEGAGWMKTVHPDESEDMARVWNDAVRSGNPFYFEFRCLRASDRNYRWCVSRAVPLRGADGTILKWYGTVVDFHDRKQAQEDLRNTQAELAHVNRVITMGELTASIAHEVSQPLAAIIASGDSCTAWLANEPPNLERARIAANRVIQAATQASETVQRIRALFKKTSTSTMSVDVNAVIEDTISLLRYETQRHNISLWVELDAETPSVPADRVQLQQVILNLVMNAIESTASVDTEPKRLVIQSARSNPREILVSVTDTGPGIDAAHADRLFAPFFTTKPQGIGMGLPISRSIIEAHGGRLWAENNEPRGAVFHFILPTGTSGL
jgi:PAS domain S-box-containing protein